MADATAFTQDGSAYAGPAVRKLAREFGLDLATVAGSGEVGRIQAEDLHRHVRQAVAHRTNTTGPSSLPPALAPVQPPGRDFDFVPDPAWSGRATVFEDADITGLDALCQQFNASDPNAPQVTLPGFLAKALVASLRQFDRFNAAVEGDTPALKYDFDIGFATETQGGFLVPVIRHVDRKGLRAISSEIADLPRRARDREIRAPDMEGGCITIFSLDGGRGFTPALNVPETASIGVVPAATKPVWDGEAFAPRLILPVSLTWDRRVADDAYAVRFLNHFATLLGDIQQILL